MPGGVRRRRPEWANDRADPDWENQQDSTSAKLESEIWTQFADHHPGPRLPKVPHTEASQKTALDHTSTGSETSCTTGGNHRRRHLLGIAAALICGSTVWADGPGNTPAIQIRATPVEITGGVLDGLVLHGTVELDSDNPNFGGFSGLSVQDGHLIAVSDRGHWLLADIEDRPNGLFPTKAGYAPMRDDSGERMESSGRDAEGLTLRDGNLIVSFERDHRIAFHLQDGWLGDDFYDRAFEGLGNNKGLEGLATTPDG